MRIFQQCGCVPWGGSRFAPGIPNKRCSGASRLGEPHLDGDWYLFGGIFWRDCGGSSRLSPNMESIESDRGRFDVEAAHSAADMASLDLTNARRRSFSEPLKEFTTITFRIFTDY